MLKEREAAVRKAVMLFDALLMTTAFFLSFLIRQHFYDFYKLDLLPSRQVISGSLASLSEYLVVLFIVVPVWSFILYLNGMYRSMRTRKLFELIWIVIKAGFFASIILGAFIFLLKITFVSRLFFFLFVSLGSSFLILEKIIIFSIMQSVRRRGYNYKRLLVVGIGKRAAHFFEKIQSHPEWGFRVIGAIDDEPEGGIERVIDVEILGNLEELPQILRSLTVDEVVFIVPRKRLHYMEKAIGACEIVGVKATIAVDLFDLKLATSRSTEIDGIPLVSFDTTVPREGQLIVKRTFDVVLSGFGLFVLSPFLLMAAILIKLTSSGPVLFKQRRVGLNGRTFTLLKFRTMYKGAEKKLTELEALNEMGGPVFKIKKDPRITPLGRILRKFSIDELPQLINVFVGHMSLVGPRPPIPDEVIQYEVWQRRRLSMRPGITCLWQISGRNKLDFDEWMKLDLDYLDNWTLWLDFKILFKTIPVVVFGIGAY